MYKKEPLERRILRSIKAQALFQVQDTVVVGVSGGPDSVCLLHILAGLRGELSIKLHVAHLNHMLRGAESDSDAEYVAALAKRLGIPETIERHDVRAYQTLHHCSLEEAAREVRYGFLAQVAKSTEASCVALGHTADDQVETVLMHLIRGTGISGLGGMKPISLWRSTREGVEIKIVRPLLGITREETESYCAAHQLSPRRDTSNESPLYVRNRIRGELVPLLKSYNPNIRAALLRAARSAADDYAWLQQEASRVWAEVVREEPEGSVLDTKAFAPLHPALKRHLLRAVLERLAGNLVDIEAVHIESMVEAMTKPAGKSLDLPGGLVLSTEYGRAIIGPVERQCPFPALDGEHRLQVPGETHLGGWRVKASVSPQPIGTQGWSADLDFDQAGNDLVVRSRRPGDRFQPLGMSQPKKLQDFMVDAKVPRAWRDRVPLVCSPSQIVWVAGWRIDERVKISGSTQRVLHLEFERVATE